MMNLKSLNEDENYTFGRVNYILVLIGVVILVIGFILLSGGAVSNPNEFYPDGDHTKVPAIFDFRRLTLAPIVLLVGFFFEFFAILWKPKSKKDEK